MGAHSGSRHHSWNGGVHVTRKGYRRISQGTNRNKYEHRVVVERLLENPVGLLFTPGQKIPENMTVHHLDFTKRHNCEGNLLMLEKVIHDYLYNGYIARLRFLQECAAAGTDGDVPF